ncbi:MAG: hypothetical protein PHG05_00065 [Candidatus Nanoarchaeia archaeon]|nr:hypothetical protein [Candidatus Nanoarchaeia archaeon]
MDKIDSLLNNKRISIYLLIFFTIVIITLAMFSNRLSFHDTQEYIVVSKYLAGIDNIKPFSAHSIVYPVIISFFLKILTIELTLKLANALWIILIGFLLLNFKSKKLILLYIFSPMVYILFPQVTPTLPAAFFFLLAYLFIKKYEETNKKQFFIFSGLSLGMCFALYTPMIILMALFILAYFYDKKLTNVIYYLLLLIPGLLIELVVDQIYFGFPFYSIIRYLGSNVLVALGLNQNISFDQTYHFINSIPLLIFGISPLLVLIFKAKFKEFKREFIFIIPFVLFFLYRGGAQLKYIFLVAPILLLILSKILTKKLVIVSIIISIIITPFLISDYFGETTDKIIKDDINSIKQDFNPKEVLAGKNLALVLAGLQFKDSIYIVWPEEIGNKTTRSYKFVMDSKIDVLNSIEFTADMKINNPEKYDNLLLVERKDQTSKDYKELKCYKELCVYEKLD